MNPGQQLLVKTLIVSVALGSGSYYLYRSGYPFWSGVVALGAVVSQAPSRPLPFLQPESTDALIQQTT